ncbi:MAG: hypothetical protein FWF69_10180 [Firmicutes bacterium]|nr:hypothetical protein [Bacillota bacterium]
MENIARTGRGGWKEKEVSQLREAVLTAGGSGEPLRGVFERIGNTLGRKPNSVRNYYYACLKRENAESVPHAAPFETFTAEEVRELVRKVLTARGQGISVRACVQNLSGGDRRLMLRYQNKYRSVLKTRPGLIREIMAEMETDGEPVFDPYAAEMMQAKPLHEHITSTILSCGDPCLLGLLRGLDTLLARAGMMEPAPLKEACEPMVQCVKEFLGLPADARADELSSFCDMLSEHIGAVENVMGA